MDASILSRETALVAHAAEQLATPHAWRGAEERDHPRLGVLWAPLYVEPKLQWQMAAEMNRTSDRSCLRVMVCVRV